MGSNTYETNQNCFKFAHLEYTQALISDCVKFQPNLRWHASYKKYTSFLQYIIFFLKKSNVESLKYCKCKSNVPNNED